MSDKHEQRIKQQLDEELSQFQFSKKAKILQQTHPHTFLSKVRYWWNKELTIPIIPVSAIIIIMIGINFTNTTIEKNKEKKNTVTERQLVKVAGNIYWNDLLKEEQIQ